MKKLNQIMLLIMTLSIVTFSSCSSDDDGGNGEDAPSGVLTAKVDGTNYQSLEISSSATISNAGGTTSLIIIATNSDGNAFAFTIFGYEGADKTYPLGGGANIFNSASYSETAVDLTNPQNSTTELWQAPYDDTMVGEINVSEETDTELKGTFSFTCKNVGGDQSIKSISEGSFSLGKRTI